MTLIRLAMHEPPKKNTKKILDVSHDVFLGCGSMESPGCCKVAASSSGWMRSCDELAVFGTQHETVGCGDSNQVHTWKCNSWARSAVGHVLFHYIYHIYIYIYVSIYLYIERERGLVFYTSAGGTGFRPSTGTRLKYLSPILSEEICPVGSWIHPVEKLWVNFDHTMLFMIYIYIYIHM